MAEQPPLIVPLYAGEERREWCGSCLLPSVLVVDVLTMNDDGVSVLTTYRECQDCGPST